MKVNTAFPDPEEHVAMRAMTPEEIAAQTLQEIKWPLFVQAQSTGQQDGSIRTTVAMHDMGGMTWFFSGYQDVAVLAAIINLQQKALVRLQTVLLNTHKALGQFMGLPAEQKEEPADLGPSAPEVSSETAEAATPPSGSQRNHKPYEEGLPPAVADELKDRLVVEKVEFYDAGAVEAQRPEAG